jgi:hypothetical protein
MTTRPVDLPMRLHTLLDQRRDPLDEPDVQAWLLERPDQLEAFARWRSALGTTPMRAPQASPSRRWKRLLPLAAVLLAAAVVGTRQCVVRPASAPLPRPDFAAAGRIVSFSTCLAVVGSGDAEAGHAASWSATTCAGTAAVHRAATVAWRAFPYPSVPICVMAIRAEENEPSCPRP